MIAAVCLDNQGGMMFNHRRQSRDSALTEDLLRERGVARLIVSDYSAPLFSGKNFAATNVPFESAMPEDVCFFEDTDPSLFIDRIDKFIIYRWNRDYPADVFFSVDMEKAGYQKVSMTEFSGTSHEKITKETWIKQGERQKT